MRYTEKEYDYEYGDMKEWLQNSAALLIVAPLRLFNEISTKLIYLNRKLIQKILNLTVIIGFLCTGVYIGVSCWLNEFDLWKGKLPVVLQIAACLVLLVINLWYRFYDFAIYQHLSTLLPIVTGITFTENQQEDTDLGNTNDNFDFENSVTMDDFKSFEESIFTELDTTNMAEVTPNEYKQDKQKLEELAEKLTNDLEVNYSVNDSSFATEVELSDISDDILDLLNEDLIDDTTTIDYQNFVNTEVDSLDVEDNERDLVKEMDDSTDPSKYVSEEGLFRFLSEMGGEDFGTIEIYSGWSTPDDFNLVG